MSIINLTKHTVNIFDEGGQEIMAVEPSGFEARIKTSIEKIGQFNGVPLFETTVLGTPYVQDEIGNNEHMRDNEGKVIGCVGLSR